MIHINTSTKQNSLTDIENRLWLPRGREDGRGKEWEFGIHRDKLLYRGWINDKVLLYSTGNCNQQPEINQSGKEHTCVTVSLLYRRNEYNIVNQLWNMVRSFF